MYSNFKQPRDWDGNISCFRESKSCLCENMLFVAIPVLNCLHLLYVALKQSFKSRLKWLFDLMGPFFIASLIIHAFCSLSYSREI